MGARGSKVIQPSTLTDVCHCNGVTQRCNVCGLSVPELAIRAFKDPTFDSLKLIDVTNILGRFGVNTFTHSIEILPLDSMNIKLVEPLIKDGELDSLFLDLIQSEEVSVAMKLFCLLCLVIRNQHFNYNNQAEICSAVQPLINNQFKYSIMCSGSKTTVGDYALRVALPRLGEYYADGLKQVMLLCSATWLTYFQLVIERLDQSDDSYEILDNLIRTPQGHAQSLERIAAYRKIDTIPVAIDYIRRQSTLLRCYRADINALSEPTNTDGWVIDRSKLISNNNNNNNNNDNNNNNNDNLVFEEDSIFSCLSTEIKIQIFESLEFADIHVAMRVCHRWKSIIESMNPYWLKHIRDHGPHNIEQHLIKNSTNYRRLLVSRCDLTHIGYLADNQLAAFRFAAKWPSPLLIDAMDEVALECNTEQLNVLIEALMAYERPQVVHILMRIVRNLHVKEASLKLLLNLVIEQLNVIVSEPISDLDYSLLWELMFLRNTANAQSITLLMMNDGRDPDRQLLREMTRQMNASPPAPCASSYWIDTSNGHDAWLKLAFQSQPEALAVFIYSMPSFCWKYLSLAEFAINSGFVTYLRSGLLMKLLEIENHLGAMNMIFIMLRALNDEAINEMMYDLISTHHSRYHSLTHWSSMIDKLPKDATLTNQQLLEAYESCSNQWLGI